MAGWRLRGLRLHDLGLLERLHRYGRLRDLRCLRSVRCLDLLVLDHLRRDLRRACLLVPRRRGMARAARVRCAYDARRWCAVVELYRNGRQDVLRDARVDRAGKMRRGLVHRRMLRARICRTVQRHRQVRRAERAALLGHARMIAAIRGASTLDGRVELGVRSILGCHGLCAERRHRDGWRWRCRCSCGGGCGGQRCGRQHRAQIVDRGAGGDHAVCHGAAGDRAVHGDGRIRDRRIHHGARGEARAGEWDRRKVQGRARACGIVE